MAALQKFDTVLSEVQAACKSLSLAPPLGVYDSADENAIVMGQAVNHAGMMVNDAREWQQQLAFLTYTGDGVTTQFDLPADFGRVVDQCFWSYTQQRPVVPVNHQQWMALSNSLVGSPTLDPVCMIIQDQFRFLTAPTSGEVINLLYVSSNWVRDAIDASMKSFASRNGDIPVFDRLLMVHAIRAKWLELKAMDNAGAMVDFTERLAQLTQNESLAPVLSLNGGMGHFRYLDGLYNVPMTGYGA